MNDESSSVLFFGIVIGFALSGILTYLIPRELTAVNQELLKADLAYRDKMSGVIYWNDIEKEEK